MLALYNTRRTHRARSLTGGRHYGFNRSEKDRQRTGSKDDVSVIFGERGPSGNSGFSRRGYSRSGASSVGAHGEVMAFISTWKERKVSTIATSARCLRENHSNHRST